MYSGAKRAVVDPLRAAGGQIADGWTSVYNNANAVADGKMSFTDALADAGKTFVTNYVSAIVSVPMGVVGVYEGYAKTIGHIAEGDYEAAAASWTESSIGAVGIAAGARTGFKGGCRHSFAPTTAVLLADGTRRAISDVGVGDLVLATDPETGETTEKPVTDLHKNQDRELTDLTVRTEDGEFTTLHTTQHHPFWSESRRDWVDAAELQPTERLHTSTGEAVTVAKVRNFIDDQTMRDLTVADLHTYYVIAGNAPVLVHNGGGKPFSDRHGNLTDGKHTVSEAAMAPHTTGSFAGKMLPDGTAMPAGKSQFLFRVDASAEALKAARYADANKLWIGNKAKVFVSNGPIGVLGRTGELTSWMTVTRSGRTIHAWPSGAP
ncbi:polymorphic toxin-type HINT domain-containing protein [Micromonospora sp. CB01531]|uniref:polymorphic toxin-type HINT domain-containing protein n=1 Tax=Micromonospora sp. CB01531 TaxID=1718947 RepID=UPI003FCF3F9C